MVCPLEDSEIFQEHKQLTKFLCEASKVFFQTQEATCMRLKSLRAKLNDFIKKLSLFQREYATI